MPLATMTNMGTATTSRSPATKSPCTRGQLRRNQAATDEAATSSGESELPEELLSFVLADAPGGHGNLVRAWPWGVALRVRRAGSPG